MMEKTIVEPETYFEVKDFIENILANKLSFTKIMRNSDRLNNFKVGLELGVFYANLFKFARNEFEKLTME